MSTNVGEIYYEVSADVAGLIQGQRQADRALDSMEESFNSTNRASENLDTGLTKLAATIKTVIAAAALREMAEMVQKYQEMAERVQMATTSQSEFEMVQKRLLNTANGTYRALGEAQELYIRTADSLRSMGYATAQAMDVQDSMSYAFVKNATSADRAGAAIDAFSKSINTGKVAADQWETLTTAIPSVINDIAAASGQSAAAIRALGASGQLTAKQLTEGLRQSLEENTAAAAGMSNNLVDAGVRIRTAVTEILVAFENETGVLQEFTSGLISAADGMLAFSRDSSTMSTAINAMTTAAMIFAAVMGARYVGSLKLATAEKIKGVIASRQQAAAELQASQAAASKAAGDLRAAAVAKSRALDEVRLAEMMKQTAISQANATAAEQRLSAARVEAAGAVDNYNRALAANNAAQSSLVGGSGLAGKALGLIGGPAGAAMLAASAILYFSQKAKEAREDANSLADSVNELSSKFQTMSHTELSATIGKLSQSLPELSDAVSDAKKEFNDATAAVQRQEREIANWGTGTTRGRQAVEALGGAQDKLAIATMGLEKAQNRLSQTQNAINIGRATLNGTLRQGIDLLHRDGEAAGVAAGMMNNLGKMLNYATVEKEKFNSSSIKIERPKGVQDYLDKLSAQVELQGELNERKRAQLKAEQEIRQLGGNDNDVRLARERAAAEFDSVEAQKAQKKAADQTASSGKRAETQAESIAQKLANLKQQAELAAGSTSELSREQAILAAQQSLGKGATKEQLALAAQYRGEAWDTTNALKAQTAAEKLLQETRENASYKQDLNDLMTALNAKKISIEQFNQTAERLEATHQNNLAKIRAQQAVTPQQEAASGVDPVQQLANHHAQQMALIQQYEQQGVITHQNALMLRASADKEYEQARIAAQWEIWRNQSLANEAAAAAFDSFAGSASNALTGIITGSMSASDALRSIGSTVLNSVINTFVQMGMEWAKAAIMGATTQQTAIAATTAAQVSGIGVQTAASTTAAATTTAAWTPAAIMSSIASFGGAVAIGLGAVAAVAALSGKRKNGGPVSAGGMYQVGEGGMPEIYRASTGKQYMIPGDNGRVISNKDMQGGGGINVSINVQNYNGSAVDAQASSDGNGGVTVDMIVADLNNGGMISQGITSNFNVKRTPRGQN
ncbi:tape measure protein [Escherichia coli]|nr:tape measure protein [Escherichia coli]